MLDERREILDNQHENVQHRYRVDTVQRVLDVALILATAPFWGFLLMLAAAWIFLDTGRPVLFTQVRMGKHQRPFRILKLRTMHQRGVQAPAGLFEGWTYEGDPRVTPSGHVLRRYRLDELPQLVNVLRGDMSLVGPRPEPWEIAFELGKQIPSYHLRHEVRPGLTGLCQVSPLYYQFGTLEQQEKKTELDIKYVQHRSLHLYAHVLWKSIPTLLSGSGVV